MSGSESTDGAWGPEVRGGRRRRRPFRWVLLGLLLLLLAVVVLGAGAAAIASARVDRMPVDNLRSAGVGPMNVLVVGSDSRADLTPEQRRELTTGQFEGERADTLFILQIGWRSSAILAFPRDLEVVRCDGSTGRINAAVAIRDGPACLVETVENLSGIPIHHYVEVGFLGFVEIVEAVGGVEICIDQAMRDPLAGIDLPEGCQTLDGADALGFVRTRRVGGDLERIQRQKQFLRALASEIVTPTNLIHIPRLYRTSGSIGDALIADSGFRFAGPLRFGVGAMTMAFDRSITYTVPNEPGQQARLRIIEAEAAPIFARFRDGSVLREVGNGDVQPAEVNVAVLNGSGVSGLATAVANGLEAVGFRIARIGNTDPVETSIILYPSNSRAEADTLARHLPRGIETREDPGAGTVTLLLGPDAADW